MSSGTGRLFLCEKPSQAKDVARVLGATRRGEGCITAPDVAVTWCIGHLLESAPPEAYGEQYKRWSIEHLPIIPPQWRFEVKASTAGQFKVVQRLLARATAVVIATDADREGEMIAREVLEFCGYRGPVQRLWLSALNDSSIRQALARLRPGQDTAPLYHAALARSCADWLVGMNLTRLFTILGRRAGYGGVLTVGRVQTPTLQLVVQRDRELAAFVPVPYWAIEVILQAKGETFAAQWVPPVGSADEAGRCLQHAMAVSAGHRLRAARWAQVESIDTEHVREAPPLPFDLSTLQTLCSRRLGLDVQETLNLAQSLYETHKAITYPRSDCGYLPESMLAEVSTVLDSLVTADPTLAPLMRMLDRTQRSRAWNDRKISAHHGIIPTLEPPRLSAMSVKERAVYQLVRAHYLAQFLPHYEYDRTTAHLKSATEMLRARGLQVMSLGWRSVFDRSSESTDAKEGEPPQALPNLDCGERCALTDVQLRGLKTAPPKPYTQGELITAMKNIAQRVSDPRLKQILKATTGIGTEATRANIIEGLIHRGYVVKEGRRAIRASPAAFTLIDAIPAAIADPGTTALWEQSLERIAARELTLEEFVRLQSIWVGQMVEQYSQASLSVAAPSGPACPQCGGAMRKRTGKRGPFWSCLRYPQCKASLPIDP